MSGAVFHPGHDDLHGMTVVVLTQGPLTVVGRWDAVRNGLVHLNDCALHDGADPVARDAFLTAQKTYGVAVEHRTLTVPEKTIARVVRLREWSADAPS